ncbi:heparin lyase I family protein [Roseobacter sp. HKCC-CH-9208]|uniref:heparin lyase I family protein n=1 Tax=Roseobacter sp. HKCC-CH-9208 TaxID=3120339 RepID=UPI0030EEB2C6
MRLRSFVCSIAIWALAGCVSSGVDGLNGAEVNEISGNQPYSISTSSDHARVGDTSQRFELRHGDCRGYDCDNDRQRIELLQSYQAENTSVGETIWYGWSIYLPEDFQDISPANTLMGQVKLKDWRGPMWSLEIKRGALSLVIENAPNFGTYCPVVWLSQMRGRWTDIVVKADYRLRPQESRSLEFWVNGQRSRCGWSGPLISQEMLDLSTTDRLSFRYGIYNSYVSRWLSRNATRRVTADQFVDLHEDSGHIARSPSNTPFLYDWGVELPTFVAYYDEVRVGSSREAVDVRMIYDNN